MEKAKQLIKSWIHAEPMPPPSVAQENIAQALDQARLDTFEEVLKMCDSYQENVAQGYSAGLYAIAQAIRDAKEKR